MNAGLCVGDKVRYSAQFLRSTGMYAGPVPHARGTITKLETFSPGAIFATVEWDTLGTLVVNVGNLIRQGERED